MNKEKIALLIPALKPDGKLIGVIKGLKELGFQKFLIVNDGSPAEYDGVFAEARSLGAHVISHYVNMGKGRALKDGFNHLYYAFPDFEAVVTLDADGQHLPGDVERVAEAALNHPDSLILGSRSFDRDVPLRSRFGNRMTSRVMRIFCGMKIGDTQTGLRGFSREVLKNFLTSKGERYEYEMNVLLDSKEREIGIVEVPINTVYIDGNSSSHFNPIKDSLRIYSLFFKYIFTALFCFAVDIAIFTVLTSALRDVMYASYIFIATVASRALSSLVNFFLNKKAVFGADKGSTARQALEYFGLVLLNVAVSSLITNGVVKSLSLNETLVKLLVDTVLIAVNFVVQREIIFKKKREK